jgi:hypothetical protein
MQIETCPAGDAGAGDAGKAERTVVLDDAAIAGIRAAYGAVVEDTAAADAGCSGFDGTSYELTIGASGQDAGQSVRFEYNCSGPPPDLRVGHDGFLTLRRELFTVAGVPYTVPF